jgi:hypothetical protein
MPGAAKGLKLLGSRMLKITVEVISPGGGRGRTIATAKIGRLRRSPAPDYIVMLEEDMYQHPAQITLKKYPRFSASIWDLVARAIAIGLTGKERLPRRPLPVGVPIHSSSDGTEYVRLVEIPEPAASIFRRRIEFSTSPVIYEDPTPRGCAYASDWSAFLSGGR